MTTLIAAYNSEGCIGRCDSKCHDAEGPDCDCICGGKNHGVGIKQAFANTQEMALETVEQVVGQEARIELEQAIQPILI
jgi:hypothetical protein